MDYGLRVMLGGGMFFWLIPLILLIIIVISAYKGFGSKRNSTPSKDALDILKERYAKGDISESEYERMKNTLKE